MGKLQTRGPLFALLLPEGVMATIAGGVMATNKRPLMLSLLINSQEPSSAGTSRPGRSRRTRASGKGVVQDWFEALAG
jgi:hypothetical protein